MAATEKHMVKPTSTRGCGQDTGPVQSQASRTQCKPSNATKILSNPRKKYTIPTTTTTTKQEHVASGRAERMEWVYCSSTVSGTTDTESTTISERIFPAGYTEWNPSEKQSGEPES